MNGGIFVKIERISETQIRFVLMTQDLEERDIRIAELSYASDKTQQLFGEIMQLVQTEYEFTEESTPLMFEAMRMGVDNLVVVVTKISNSAEAEQRLNLIPQAKTECKFKRNGFIEQPPTVGEDSHSMFSFADIDAVAAGIKRICDHFKGPSAVYKMESRYYLTLQNETEDDLSTKELEAILYEFGQKHVSNMVSKQYLAERGEVIIASDAVNKLRSYSDFVLNGE